MMHEKHDEGRNPALHRQLQIKSSAVSCYNGETKVHNFKIVHKKE